MHATLTPVPLVLVLLGVVPGARAADAFVRKPERVRVEPWHDSALVAVKFRDGVHVRCRAGALTDGGTGELVPARTALAGPARGRWERTHGLDEAVLDRLRAEAQARSAREIPDLNLEFRLRLEPGCDPGAAIDALNALDAVELAWPAPRPAPPPSVPDFASCAGAPPACQGYLDAAPGGIGARQTWPRPSGTGRRVRICDVEYLFDPQHRELDQLPLGTTIAPPSNFTFGPDHGTAVMGMLFAEADGEGTTGMAYESEALFSPAESSLYGYNVARAITDALPRLEPGDVILLEQQLGVGMAGAYVPVEADLSYYNAIVFAVGQGIHVVEAAGNGAQNLDDPFYGGWFSPAHDSGAILVGAGGAPGGADRARLAFSNYGLTVDLQGWGERVVTAGLIAGYTGLSGFPGSPDAYMSDFNGTSSASPMVAAACAVLGSTFEAQTGWPMAPEQMRATLITTGTSQTSGGHIGPRPDLVRAMTELELWRIGDDDPWSGGSTFGPPPRRDAALAYDSARGRVALFGGDGGGFDWNDLWFLESDILGYTFQWTLSPAFGPGPRSGAALAYDRKRDRLVLHGGTTFGVPNGETWEYDPSHDTWALVGFGLARSGHVMAYDPQRERVVLVGGDCGAGCGDTWEWDGSTWQWYPGPFPSGRIRSSMAWDPDRARMVLYGGHDPLTLSDTSEIAERVGATWVGLGSPAGPSPRSGAGMAYDTSRRRCVLLGGEQNGVFAPLGDTWEWNGSAWHQDATSFSFFARSRHGLAYDESAGRLLGFGGSAPGLPACDTTLARDRYYSLGAPYCFGDGSGAACPCGNASPVFDGTGCRNSLGVGGKLRSLGRASLYGWGSNSAVLLGSNMPNSSALYYQGTLQQSGGNGAPFGDGLRCVTGSVIRLATKSNAGGSSQYPEGGDLPIAVKGLVTTPGIRTYQVWYRNAAPFCTSATFNLTNGLQVVWGL